MGFTAILPSSLADLVPTIERWLDYAPQYTDGITAMVQRALDKGREQAQKSTDTDLGDWAEVLPRQSVLAMAEGRVFGEQRAAVQDVLSQLDQLAWLLEDAVDISVWDDERLHIEANRVAQEISDTITLLGTIVDVPYGVRPPSDPYSLICPRWWYRALRARQAEVEAILSARIGGVGGRRGRRHANRRIMALWRRRLKRQDEWHMTHRIRHHDTGEIVSIPRITPDQRRAHLLATSRGIETLAARAGLDCGLFVTTTLPSGYHLNPTKGKDGWNGATPRDGSDELQHRWARSRAYLNYWEIPITGLRSIELHGDITPHRHYTIHHNDCDMNVIAQTLIYNHSEYTDLRKGKPGYWAVDANGKPYIDECGQPVYVPPEPPMWQSPSDVIIRPTLEITKRADGSICETWTLAPVHPVDPDCALQDRGCVLMVYDPNVGNMSSYVAEYVIKGTTDCEADDPHAAAFRMALPGVRQWSTFGVPRVATLWRRFGRIQDIKCLPEGPIREAAELVASRKRDHYADFAQLCVTHDIRLLHDHDILHNSTQQAAHQKVRAAVGLDGDSLIGRHHRVCGIAAEDDRWYTSYGDRLRTYANRKVAEDYPASTWEIIEAQDGDEAALPPEKPPSRSISAAPPTLH
jgi:hypothetical protein